MSYLNTINTNQLCVGDIVHVHYPSTMFVNQKVFRVSEETDYIGTKSIDDGVEEGFSYTLDRDRTFFLVKRPKQPLPTAIGSVVEVRGDKFVRVREDSDFYNEWVYDDQGDNAETSSILLSKRDYTVV